MEVSLIIDWSRGHVSWVSFWLVTHLNWMYWLIVWFWPLRWIVLFLGWLNFLFKGDCSKHTRAKWSYPPHFKQVCPLAGQSAHLCGPLISPHQWHVFGSRLSFISWCFFRNDFDLPDPVQLTVSSVPLVVSKMSLLVFWADSMDLATTSAKALLAYCPVWGGSWVALCVLCCYKDQKKIYRDT